MRNRSLVFSVALLVMGAPAQAPTIATVAGVGTYGYSGDGGPATLAELRYPANIAIDAAGNIYFNDWDGGQPIRRVDGATGTITTVVGGGSLTYPNDGELATDIALGGYGVLAVDAAGNLYFTDITFDGRELIRRCDVVTGRVTTVAGGGAPLIVVMPTGQQGMYAYIDEPTWTGDGGPATEAYLKSIFDMAIDASGNIFIADYSIVRRVDASTGFISTIAGNSQLVFPFPPNVTATVGIHGGDGGPATSAGFTQTTGIALDAAGNVYVSEAWDESDSVRKIDALTGIITTVAGQYGQAGYSGDGGPATAATLGNPAGLAVDAMGNLYIAESENNVIRRVDASTGIISTIAGDGTYGYGGDGGPASSATLAYPYDVAFDAEGNLYVTDTDNSRIRKLTLNPNAAPTADAGPDQSIHASGMVQLDGSGSFDDNTPTASLVYAWSLVTRPAGSAAFLSDPSIANPTFVADQPGTYIAQLIVEDSANLASTVAQVAISSTNLAPTANAGPDQGGVVNQLVQLDGSSSTDPELDPLGYAWAFTSTPTGSSAQLSNPFAAAPTFVPDLAGTYTVGMIVDDGFGPSFVDEVMITVVTGQQFAETTTAQAINTTSALPSASVTTAGNQQALVNLLSHAVQGVQSSNLAQARMKLEAAIARTDGWALRGAPDQTGAGRDWVTDRDESISLYNQLVAALAALP